MAVIKPVVVDVSVPGDESCYQVIWNPITEADTCGEVSYPKYSDKSIQLSGTLGGATLVLNGSNDGVTYAGLRDPSHTAISMNAAGIQQVLENTVFVRPALSGGTGQSAKVSMLFHLSNPLRQ